MLAVGQGRSITNFALTCFDKRGSMQSGVGCGLLVVADSILRNIERGICGGCGDYMVTSLPGAKVCRHNVLCG